MLNAPNALCVLRGMNLRVSRDLVDMLRAAGFEDVVEEKHAAPHHLGGGEAALAVREEKKAAFIAMKVRCVVLEPHVYELTRCRLPHSKQAASV